MIGASQAVGLPALACRGEHVALDAREEVCRHPRQLAQGDRLFGPVIPSDEDALLLVEIARTELEACGDTL